MSVVVVQRPALSAGVVVGDPHWSSVSFLCSFDGLDGATTTTDDSDTGHTITMTHDAELDTAQKKFGESSLLMDGITDNRTKVAKHADFDFGAGQFTVEGWFYWDSLAVIWSINALADFWDIFGSNRKWIFNYATSGALEFHTSSDGVEDNITSGSWTPTINTWHHIAVDRDASDVIRVYADGVVIGSSTDASDIYTYSGETVPLSIGHTGTGSSQLDGWIDEVRITKGIARYGGAFTVPTTAFPKTL